jgi:ERCC4-type nuclease
MKQDSHEPDEMARLLTTCVSLEIEALNEHGYADYLWEDYEGKLVQVERKTWNELLADLDSVEEQVRKEIVNNPDVRTMLVVEGTAIPTVSGTTTLGPTRGSILVPKSNYSRHIQMVYGWLYQVEKHCEVYMTSCLHSTARALIAFCQADQKEDHNTFSRYIKQIQFDPNPQVQMLMNMYSGLGEVKAKALIEDFGTVWRVLHSSPEQLQIVGGIGNKIALKLLRGVGRTDI